MRKLTITEKVLMATGAVVLAGAAAIGIAALVKKRKELSGEIKELVIESDEMDDEQEELLAE